jgi:hypothetical protein
MAAAGSVHSFRDPPSEPCGDGGSDGSTDPRQANSSGVMAIARGRDWFVPRNDSDSGRTWILECAISEVLWVC